MNQDSSPGVVGSGRLSRFISNVLIFLMMTCVIMTIANLIQNTLPDWHSGIIAGITLFIVIDRLYIFEQFKSLTPLSSEWAITFGSQWFVIVLFIKTLLSYASGLDSFMRDLSLYTRGNFEGLFNPEFVVTLLLALLAWYLSGEFLGLLDEVGLDQALALRESAPPLKSGLTSHQKLANLIFSTGIALVILTALARVDWRAIFLNAAGASTTPLNHFSGGEMGALLYFFFGLALLSQSRLMSLQTRWNQQRIPVSSKDLSRQWGTYSLVFILLLVIIISALPSGDNLGFFSVLGAFLGFLFNIIFFAAQLIFNLIYLLFSLPFFLLGRTPPFTNTLPTPPPLPDPATETAAPTAMDPIWALIRSIFLWGALIVIIVFSVGQFLKQHGGLVATLRKMPFTNWLIHAWQVLRGNWNKATATISQAIADGWQNIVSRLEGNRILPHWNLIRPRLFDPRRQIYFFYLAMIRRGSDQGMARKPSQTPSEYADTLENALPSLNEDVHLITESFIEARYSPHTIDSQKANLVKVAWKRVRRALQIGKNPKNVQPGGK
jgi:hypothetical protein